MLAPNPMDHRSRDRNTLRSQRDKEIETNFPKSTKVARQDLNSGLLTPRMMFFTLDHRNQLSLLYNPKPWLFKTRKRKTENTV